MLAIPKVTPPKLERNELEMNIKNNLQRFVVLKWYPVLQNHLVRRYGKISDDMRKNLILSHFFHGVINIYEGLYEDFRLSN